jgi:hypothetical protein
VLTHFGDSIGESTTSSTPSMNDGNSGNNRSDLDKGNILRPTFETMTEEGHKVFEAIDFLSLLCLVGRMVKPH